SPTAAPSRASRPARAASRSASSSDHTSWEDRMKHRLLGAAVAVATILAAAATQGWSAEKRQRGAATHAHAAEASGLGEIMALQQMRHIKLWYAGSSANWELAAYELDELKEGFDDVLK